MRGDGAGAAVLLPAGGPLGSLEHPFPDGASGQGAAVDGQGNTYLAWTRAGTLEERVRMRDGSSTAIRTVQTKRAGGEVAVSRDGKATFVWLANNADRTGGSDAGDRRDVRTGADDHGGRRVNA